jgi:hypothetical protein
MMDSSAGFAGGGAGMDSSSGSGGGAGMDGSSGSDGGAGMDASAVADGSAGADGGPAATCAPLTRSVCVDCCDEHIPGGLRAYGAAIYGCGCSQCGGECYESLCNSVVFPSVTCIACVKSAPPSLGCPAVDTCPSNDAVCLAFSACVAGCF